MKARSNLLLRLNPHITARGPRRISSAHAHTARFSAQNYGGDVVSRDHNNIEDLEKYKRFARLVSNASILDFQHVWHTIVCIRVLNKPRY